MTRILRRTLLRNWNRLLGSLFRRKADDDLAEEIDSHIQMLAEENVRRGLPPDEARRRAKLRFGSVESAKQSYRDQRRLPALDAIGSTREPQTHGSGPRRTTAGAARS